MVLGLEGAAFGVQVFFGESGKGVSDCLALGLLRRIGDVRCPCWSTWGGMMTSATWSNRPRLNYGSQRDTRSSPTIRPPSSSTMMNLSLVI